MGEDRSWFRGSRKATILSTLLLVALIVIVPPFSLIDLLTAGSRKSSPALRIEIDERAELCFEVPERPGRSRLFLEWWGSDGLLGRALARRRLEAGELVTLTLLRFSGAQEVVVRLTWGTDEVRILSLPFPPEGGLEPVRRWVHPGDPNPHAGDALLRLGPKGPALPTDPTAPDPAGVISLRLALESERP